jgi:nucleoside diphosphate kinase
MAIERTFSIIKPDATTRNLTGAINALIEKYRDVMGATDPSKAADGTIRKLHANSIGENSVHGSDAAETAAIEIAQFFSGNEIVG